jgi:hypothetical protein
MRKKWLNVIVFFVVFLACSSVDRHPPATTFVEIDNDSIRYTGRMGRTQDAVTIYWPGSMIHFRFNGGTVRAKLKDQHGQNYFNVIIDGDSLHYFRVDSQNRSYLLAKNLPAGTHSIQLIKRTEWDKGNTWFYGIEIEGGKLVELPAPNKRVIEFFGNSITAGYAIEDRSGKDSPDSINTNNYYTYAALTARHFKADYYCTVKSGIGIMISWAPLIMPEMYNRLDPTDPASRWEFRKVKPQVVVINLFQNDRWLIEMPDHPSFKQRFGSKRPEEKTIIESYRAFVEKIRIAYPDAYIICALGSMDAVKEGAPWPGYVQRAVSPLNDNKILTYFFPYSNKPGHPDIAQNRIMADSLIAFIEKNIRW